MAGMTIIVKKITQLIAGLIFVFGLYIVLHGHLSPGGGFAGGALMAGAFILLVLSNGSAYLTVVQKEKGSARLESAAVLSFAVLAVTAGLHGGMVFFQNFLNPGTAGRFFSAGIIPVYNLLIGIEVASALLTIFYAFVIYKEELSR